MKKALLALILLTIVSCHHSNPPGKPNPGEKGSVIVFHAGSLSVPFQKIARAFEAENPGVKILLEAAGSVECARKITELNKPCDIMASSDYKVIEELLIPSHASWYLPFAGNEMVIAFTEKSQKQDILNQQNWMEILLDPEVRFGRSDPDADPCGYRTLMVMKLAGQKYALPRLVEQLSSKDIKYIRPKEVDLLAMLEINETDYIFIYRSVAIQHGLKYLELPDEINLKNMDFNDDYSKVSVSIRGKNPGETLEVRGETIAYAVTLINNAPNPEMAKAFLEFLLDINKGGKILEESGHNSLIPYSNPNHVLYPDYLMKYVNTNNSSI